MIQYKDFFIRLTLEVLMRQNEKNIADVRDGFLIEILDAENSSVPLEIISAAAGYELSEYSEEDATEFAKEYIDDMAAVYRELREELLDWLVGGNPEYAVQLF